MSAERRRRHRRSGGAADGENDAVDNGSRWGLVVLWLLTALAIGAAWHGVQGLQAGLRSKALEQELRELSDADHALPAPTPEVLQQRMVELGPPLSAQEAELRARLWWLAARSSTTPAARIGALRAARDALHFALARRPSWPYTWLLLAQVEYALEPRGQDAPIALGTALDLGVRGMLLQRQLLELRLEAARWLPEALQERAQQALRLGIRDHGSDLAMHLRLGQGMAWVCADPEILKTLASWCATRGWTTPP
jgi:hypothetical protein